MLSILSDRLLTLSNCIKELQKSSISQDPDMCELLDIESRIEESITELSLFFQKLPKYKTTFESIRQYYVEYVIGLNQKEKINE